MAGVSMFLSLLLAVGVARAAEVQVSATVDRNQVGVGDVVNYTISISAQDAVQVEEPNLGNLSGMELINTSTGVETRSSFQNGRFQTEQARTFTYMLAMARKGTLTIPEIPVVVDGKTYRTRPIQIAVSDARQVPPQARRGQAPDPFEQMDEMEELFNQMLQRRFRGGTMPPGQNAPDINPDEAFFIQAEVDKNRVYVGEQVTANFYLYTRGQIRDIDTLKYPDLKGFWKEDLEMATRLNFESIVVNGIPYQRALLVSYALFPIKPGKVMVDQYKAKCTVLTPSAFGFGRPYQFTKASKPIAIEVTDVPADGRPANYTGAVGSFRVAAQFEPPTGVTNQPVTLRVRFEGRGNAKLIELPKMELPPSFEFYDQKSQAKFMKDGTSYREFEVLIIPREPGVFNIPGIAIAMFDPEQKQFRTAASSALNITVTGAATPNPTAAPAQAGTTPPAPPEKTGPQLPTLATEFEAGSSGSSLPLAATVGLYLAMFMMLAQQAWVRLRRKPKKVSLSLMLKRRIKNVRDLAGKKEWRRVGVELTNAAYAILGRLAEQGGANQELARLLEQTPPSLRNELSGPIQNLLSQCEALSFAPEGLIGDMTEKGKMDKLIAEFEKVMSRAIELAEI